MELPTSEFLNVWSSVFKEELTVLSVLWDGKWAAALVQLTDVQASLYDVSVPHVSLVKPLTANWQDVGDFAKHTNIL